MTQVHIDRDWDGRYQAGETPWDSGLPSRELRRVLEEQGLPPGRALELGCGTGTNALFLAQRGFDVTAVDCSATALAEARRRSMELGLIVDWVQADVQRFGADREPFAFVFDRGCFHCCRRVDLAGYLDTLQAVTRPGSFYLSLSGNATEARSPGPPTMTEDEIREELGGLFEFMDLREFRFQDAGAIEGPLGWSTLMRRRS